MEPTKQLVISGTHEDLFGDSRGRYRIECCPETLWGLLEKFPQCFDDQLDDCFRFAGKMLERKKVDAWLDFHCPQRIGYKAIIQSFQDQGKPFPKPYNG